MQLSGIGENVKPSPIGTLSKIIKEEGILRLYKGLDAALFRQVCILKHNNSFT